MQKSEFLSALAEATLKAVGFRQRGLPIWIALHECQLLPATSTEAGTDAAFADNPLFVAIDVASRTRGVRPAYTELAVAEAAWEHYQEVARMTPTEDSR